MLSCKAQKESNSPMGEKMENLVLADFDSFSNVEVYETTVIKDAKSLSKFYAGINKTRKPGLPVPIVDFTKEMAILVCLGEQKGKTKPVLSKLNETEDELVIALEIMVEIEEETTIQPTYFPFYLYKLPLVDKVITLQKIDR